MKLHSSLLTAFLLLLPMAVAEEPPESHKKWMKDAGDAMGSLRKGVDVEKNAAQMETIFKEVHGFWSKRTSDVGGKSSLDTQAAARLIVSGAKAGDKAELSAGMKALGAACKSCHDVHREKVSEGVYTIK